MDDDERRDYKKKSSLDILTKRSSSRETTPKKIGKLTRAMHSIPIIHFGSNRDVDQKQKTSSSMSDDILSRDSPSRDSPSRDSPSRDSPSRDSPSRDSPSRDSPSGDSENTRSFKLSIVDYIINETKVTLSFDELNVVLYNIFSLKLLDDGVIFCKGLRKEESTFSFSYSLVRKGYVGAAVCVNQGKHIIKEEYEANECAMKVYSRGWGMKGISGKAYPIFICNKHASMLVKDFVKHHYLILSYFIGKGSEDS